MIIVDAALERREREGRPVHVGLVGAGYMGRGIALEVLTPVGGMRLAAVANRTLSEAVRAYVDGGVDSVVNVDSVVRLERAIATQRCAVTEDPTSSRPCSSSCAARCRKKAWSAPP